MKISNVKVGQKVKVTRGYAAVGKTGTVESRDVTYDEVYLTNLGWFHSGNLSPVTPADEVADEMDARAATLQAEAEAKIAEANKLADAAATVRGSI